MKDMVSESSNSSFSDGGLLPFFLQYSPSLFSTIQTMGWVFLQIFILGPKETIVTACDFLHGKLLSMPG